MSSYKVGNLECVIALFSVVMVIFPASSLAYVQSNRQNLKILRNIEKSMNSSANPCENFYEYACGNWAKYFVNDEVAEIITLLNQQYEATIENVIKQHYPVGEHLNKHNQNPLEKAAAYYYSCMNMEAFNPVMYLHDLAPGRDLKWPLALELMAFIGQGGINFTEQSAYGDFNIFALLGRLNSYGLSDTLTLIEADFSKNREIKLAVPTPKNLTAQEVKRVLSYFGFTGGIIQRYTEDILAIDSYWQTAYARYELYEDVGNYTYREVQHSYPELATILENMYTPFLRNEDVVVFASLSFVEFLFGQRWQPYEIEQMCNYLMIKFLVYIEDQFENGECILNLRRKMPLAVNYMYYQHIYLPETEQFNTNISHVTKLIFKQFLRTINENRLKFKNDQLTLMKQKLFEMIINVGNLPENVNLAAVDSFYSDVPHLNSKNFYKNDMLLLKHRFRESLQCSSSINCDHTIDSSPINYFLQNVIVVPFASLQLPFYHYDLHPLFAMSNFGFIMGHEFIHAIDPVSLQADINRFSPVFDDIAEASEFNSSVECMLEQQPTAYINERAADLGGARVAYETYQREYNVQPTFTKISWQQLFFLNMGQFFCGDKLAVIEDHDLDEIRLNLIAMNLEAFTEAFQCPAGSKMNPQKRCRFY